MNKGGKCSLYVVHLIEICIDVRGSEEIKV